MVEYALMTAKIAAVAVGAVTTHSTTVSAKFGAINTAIGGC